MHGEHQTTDPLTWQLGPFEGFGTIGALHAGTAAPPHFSYKVHLDHFLYAFAIKPILQYPGHVLVARRMS